MARRLRREAWDRSRQLASERPAFPLSSGCPTCGLRQTLVRTRWRAGRHCLACDGCPKCGTHQIWRTDDAPELVAEPVRLADGRRVTGDWWCLTCGEWLVKWAAWRLAMGSWLRGLAAADEGYRPRVRAA